MYSGWSSCSAHYGRTPRCSRRRAGPRWRHSKLMALTCALVGVAGALAYELLPAAVAFNISLFAAGMASICLQVYLVVELAIWQARFQASRFALLKSISTIGGLLGGLFLIKVVH